MEINRVVKWIVKNDKNEDVAKLRYEVSDDKGSYEILSDNLLSITDIVEKVHGQKIICENN